MVLCWTALSAILGRMQPMGCRLDSPLGIYNGVNSNLAWRRKVEGLKTNDKPRYHDFTTTIHKTG